MLWDLARLIFATSAVALAALGAGSWLHRLLPADFSRLERLACCWLGGFGLLGAALFLIGQVAFTPLTISLVLALGVLASIGPLMRALKVAAGLRLSVHVQLIPAGVITLILLLTAVAGLADITGDWGNDGVAYHLLGPKVWLRDGVIRPVLDNSHTAFPATAEVMYAAFLLLGGAHGPGFSAVVTLSLFLLVVAALAVRAGLDAGGAWWAVAFVASMPAIYAGAHSGFVDVLYASFVLAAARIGLDAARPKHFPGVWSFLRIRNRHKVQRPARAACACADRWNLRRDIRGPATARADPKSWNRDGCRFACWRPGLCS